MSMKSMIFKLVLRKLAPRIGRALLGANQRGWYARGHFRGYTYGKKPKPRGFVGLVVKFIKKIF